MTPFNRTFNLLKNQWAIIGFIVLVVLTYCYLDKPVAIYFHQLDLRKNLKILLLLTTLGRWEIYVALFFMAALYFRYMKKNSIYERNSWYLLACLLLANILNLVLKIGLSRARPDLLFASNLFGFYWFKLNEYYWSFPSGHAVTITALASALGVLIPRYFFVFLGVAVLVALSRVLLYHHYLSDVMTGAYLGLLTVGFFTQYMKKQ
ncbi:MAG: phosphatase PAP2 family protein [Legionellales bacterium]